MIAHLRGRVEHAAPGTAVVDVGGVGYSVRIPRSLSERLRPGQSVQLFTHLIMRDDGLNLFGFAEPEEREIFRMLCSLSGVGPSTALNILSSFHPSALAAAILDEDVAALTAVPGIGKKTARRLLLELSEKIGGLLPSAERSPAGGEGAESVLVSLGCDPAEARRAVRRARERKGKGVGPEQLVMEAMRILGEGG